jgi:outer membrane protein OmpU
VNLSYAGFTIGGSYANELDGAATAGNVAQTKGYSWDAGVSYAAGPWAVGATYFHGENEGLLSVAGEDQLDAVEVGVSYQVGPGISARGGVMWAEWETEEGEDQSGIVGAVGLSFSF